MPDKIHTTVGFYLSRDYQVEFVHDEDLTADISYNHKYRFGRFYFVDGEYVCGGVLKQPDQDIFIAQCKQRLTEMNLPTVVSGHYFLTPHCNFHRPQLCC